METNAASQRCSMRSFAAAPLEKVMKDPMFSIETDRHESLRIVVTRPDGTRITISGQSQSPVLDHEARCPQLASFLARNDPHAGR
jgi:hypothetical protein